MGRTAELAQLSRVLTEDTEHAVVVSGEPGVGKTALPSSDSERDFELTCHRPHTGRTR